VPLIVLAAALVLLAGLWLLMGARLEVATVALVLAAGSLALCLRALYRLVETLSRRDFEAVLEREAGLEPASRRELRDERRRLLRAINELRFDHDMGKLSDEDYRAVREAYELRAVEVMRALEEEPDLHPRVQQALAQLDGMPAVEPAPSAAAEAKAGEATTVRTCPACDQKNDIDARFCKSCGEALAS
jgi:hypothetical protein